MPLGWISASLYGYLLVGVQSLLYAFIMEHVINRRLGSDVVAVALSALLGALAGATMLLIFRGWDSWFAVAWFMLGAIVGLVVGYILRRMYKGQLIAR